MGRFFAKGTFFAVTLAVLLGGSEVLLTLTTPWKRYEDPRARILWDGAFDGSRIVLVGGSEFASVYVNSPSETLWGRLNAYTGQRVFPGALNGARRPDVLAAAAHVSREWPAGTTVFISVPPTGFVASRAEEPSTGNFADVFFRRYGIDAANPGGLRRLKGQIYRWCLKPFFAERTRSVLANLVDRPRPPQWMRHRVWSQDATARERFEFFERNLVLGVRPRPMTGLDQIDGQLARAHMRPVFVLTPLNEPLVRSFASVHPSDSILQDLRRTIAAVKTHLRESGATVIDLTDGVPSECFFDLVHVNTCGDDLTAMRLAQWLNKQRPE